MDFFTLLHHRESCRSYADRPVPRDLLIRIADAGRLSPSACNAQPWHFMIIDEPDAKAKLCDALVVGEKGITGCPWRAQVPAFIVLVEEPAVLMPAALDVFKNSQHFAPGDLGMAAVTMCYAARELGVSSCIVGMIDQQKMERNFGIPAGRTVRMVLALGYPGTPDEPPRRKIRKALGDICTFNAW